MEVKVNKYKMAPIVYSDVPLEGEKVKYGSGQEFVVNYSCLAEEFAHKTEVKDRCHFIFIINRVPSTTTKHIHIYTFS